MTHGDHLWARSFGLCSVALGPGAEHRYAGEPEVWVVWSQPRWASYLNEAEASDTKERRFLNGGTIQDPDNDSPTWSTRDHALYDAETAAALVLILEDLYPERVVGALRLK